MIIVQNIKPIARIDISGFCTIDGTAWNRFHIHISIYIFKEIFQWHPIKSLANYKYWHLL